MKWPVIIVEKKDISWEPVQKKSNGVVHVHTQMMDDMDNNDKEEVGYIYHQNLRELTPRTCLLIDSVLKISNWDQQGKKSTQITL